MTRVGNRKIQLIILLALVTLIGTMSIAYAFLSTTLNINGTAQVQDASWNVHFDNVQVNPYSVEINPVITDNNKVSFSADLTTPGDFYKFTVDIVNEGSIDAMIESIIKAPELTDEEKKYLRYEIEYIDGTSINDSQLLKSGETKTISILFSYRNDIPTSDLPSTESDYDLEIVLVYVQADNSGIEISGDEKLVKVVSGDLNTVGSEICIGEECFYLISSDEYSVTMLSKYNLLVGNIVEDDTWTPIPLEKTTGIQDSTAIAANFKETGGFNFPYIGTIAFSTTNYWWDSSKNLFKTDYQSDNTSFPYVYDSNSILYSHIENYKTYLEGHDINVHSARLIKISELIQLGCSIEMNSCKSAPSWVYSTSYWLGCVYDDIYVWRIIPNGELIANRAFNNGGGYGIRPVVTISKQEF